MKILILAGGTGKRLWPVSRRNNPKQLKPLIGGKSLLKETYQRIKKGFKASDVFLSVGSNQLQMVKKELGLKSPRNFIIEPLKRGTAAAIGLACLNFKPDEIIATVNSDHYIKNHREFFRVLNAAEQTVKKHPHELVLIGINPTYPETGYGYIKLGRQIGRQGKDKVFKVDGFKEKPDKKTAEKYLKSWAYLWNPAYFVFRAGAMLELFKKHLPSQYRILMKIKKKPGLLKTEFKKIKKISIDNGIMEKAISMLCLPAEFDWTDIGHWRTIHEILSGKPSKNVVKGKYIHLGGTGNLVYSYSGKLIATVGIKNSIIIETADAVLVCSKDQAQEVKKIVEKLEHDKLDEYL